MEVIIEGPHFFAQEDEDRFFQWIYSLPAYERVTGIGTKLHIALREPVDDDTVKQLLIICRRWLIDVVPLGTLKHPSNEKFALWDDGWRTRLASRK